MADDQLHALGEERVVAALTAKLHRTADVIVGAGDDCAVIGKKSDAIWTLLKTDCVIEGIHFASTTPPRRVGWKAMARALSDIAAMGGAPRHALVTIAAPSDTRLSRVKAIYDGLNSAASRFGAGLVGGETSRSPGPLFLSVALTGNVERTRCALRSGGRPGDVLFVTGRLGGSIRGRHLTFDPRLTEGRWLASRSGLKAMMDLSDGLGADLPRMAAASGCGFALEREAIPRQRGVSLDAAISDGEDYELLAAVAPEQASAVQRAWQRKFPDVPLTRIGWLVSGRPGKSDTEGYDHFA